MDNVNQRNRVKRIREYWIILIVLIILAAFVFLYLKYQNKTGVTKTDAADKAKSVDTLSFQSKDSVGEKIDFLQPMSIGYSAKDTPQISNIAVTDIDDDGLLDVIVCDDKKNAISWIRQYPAGTYSETIVADGLIAPAHVQVIDFDNDGDKDLMIAVLGALFPNDKKIGSVVVLENDGTNHFKKQVVAENIARVSDVRAGDLNGDGDMDLAVAQFGYNNGETRWIENLGKWKFQSHILQNLSGSINVIATDIDKDGDLDIVSLVSQEWEEIYCFINDGKGNFTTKLIWGSNNEDFGSSSIFISDVDKDGDEDLLYTNGDSFNYPSPADRPWHGVQWLENKGNVNFEFHRLCHFTGVYNCRPADIDKDGDVDLFAVSAFNIWSNPDAQSFIWLENIDHMQFVKRSIANAPTHLITLELGDFNNDGLMDMVTGGMHISPPYNKMGRVTLWINNGALSKKRK